MRVAAVAIALMLVVAGCGDGGGGGSQDAVAALVARAQDASDGTESYRMVLEGASDIEGSRFSMHMRGISSPDQTHGRFKGTMALGPGPEKSMEFITVGNAQFVRGAVIGGEIPQGKQWIHVEQQPTPSLSPSQFVEFLSSADEIENVGTEQVHGAPTIHLSGPLDIKKLGKATGPQAQSMVAGMPEGVKFDIDAWIRKSDARLTRMNLVITMPDSRGSMTMSADVLDYDVALDAASAPDPSTVYAP
jgi:hypothetical protein